MPGDNYPPGFSAHIDAWEIDLICPKCGEIWAATGFNELGGGFFDNDDDAYCPNNCLDNYGYSVEGIEYDAH